jgi:1-acyl-sn-glycerol-3-phosphate acyltransferase
MAWTAKLSRLIFKAWGWKMVGQWPYQCKKVVCVAAPHTSNWDFPVGVLVRSIIEADVKYIAKDSLFKPPFGWLFYWSGGWPVNRSKAHNFVDSVVEVYDAHEKFAITITPEGTRKKAEKLKTGFWHIAKRAGAHIVFCTFDWEHKEIRWSEPWLPGDDLESDLQKFYDYFRGVKGKNPEDGIM